jgi:hypothetical protein
VVNDILHSTGIGTHANSAIVIELSESDRRAEHFSFTLAFPDYMKGTVGSVRGRVLLDGIEVWASPVLRVGQIEHGQIASRDAHALKLEVLDGGDGINSDDVVWLGLKFL